MVGRYRDEHGVDRRVPLTKDKVAAQAILNDLVTRAERRAAGTIDPFEEHAKRPLKEHANDFEEYQRSKGNSSQHVGEVSTKVRKIIAGCKWAFIRDLSASGTQRYLAELRSGGLSVQTTNHYLRAIKQFSRWLVRDRRMPDDPLAHLAMLNVKVMSHDRRPLNCDEFAHLVDAAMSGPPVVCIPGPDRAMMYVLAAWTGYRKAEISSLTKRSLKLDATPPTVTVAAAYSKRKRQDTQVLHVEVASRLRAWLKTKTDLGPDELLFPVSAKIPGSPERRTSKMMKADLAAARKGWIAEAASADERKRREESDFLCYQNEDGLFADFHSNRHTFITNLSRAGVKPRTAQSLARHSDIRLTMGTYTHIGLRDQSMAIELLPAPPPFAPRENQNAALRANGTNGPVSSDEKVPTVVPRGAKNGAIHLAPDTYQPARDCTDERPRRIGDVTRDGGPKALAGATFRTASHESASPCIVPRTRKEKHAR